MLPICTVLFVICYLLKFFSILCLLHWLLPGLGWHNGSWVQPWRWPGLEVGQVRHWPWWLQALLWLFAHDVSAAALCAVPVFALVVVDELLRYASFTCVLAAVASTSFHRRRQAAASGQRSQFLRYRRRVGGHNAETRPSSTSCRVSTFTSGSLRTAFDHHERALYRRHQPQNRSIHRRSQI